MRKKLVLITLAAVFSVLGGCAYNDRDVYRRGGGRDWDHRHDRWEHDHDHWDHDRHW